MHESCHGPVETPTGSLNVAREMHASVLLTGGKVLAVGGTQAGNPQASAELYDPTTGLWSYTGGMNKSLAGVHGHAAARRTGLGCGWTRCR